MTHGEGEVVWHDKMVYLVRAYAAWYLVDAALRGLAQLGGESAGTSRYRGFVSDAYQALHAFDPPFVYHALHQDLLDTFVSIKSWLNGTSGHSGADLMEDTQIVGLELKQQMSLLGLTPYS
jgi:hypothetical protein